MLTYWTPVRGVLFGLVTVPKTTIWQCLFADITCETSMAWVLSPTPFLAWYGLNKVFINQAEGTVNKVWYWYIPHGCCHALLNMCFTSSILNCQYIFLLSEYFLWRKCALSITMFKQCTKNFFDHLTLYTENCSTVKTDLSNQHQICTCCTKNLVEV